MTVRGTFALRAGPVARSDVPPPEMPGDRGRRLKGMANAYLREPGLVPRDLQWRVTRLRIARLGFDTCAHGCCDPRGDGLRCGVPGRHARRGGERAQSSRPRPGRDVGGPGYRALRRGLAASH